MLGDGWGVDGGELIHDSGRGRLSSPQERRVTAGARAPTALPAVAGSRACDTVSGPLASTCRYPTSRPGGPNAPEVRRVENSIYAPSRVDFVPVESSPPPPPPPSNAPDDTTSRPRGGHVHAMERSLKRLRTGSSPFDADDDDELNSRPEEVNLRRDPGYQLQKSRSFAAFKLKSRFESIFEKYEKDFTDIGDEILLSTGEIAVNNGHLESLKDQHFDDGDGEEDEVEEEERILQGKHDNRLSLAHVPTPLTIQTRPPAFPAQWQPKSHLMGGPPMLSGAMYPGQMPFGAFPPPMSMSFDPMWNAPALPMPTFGSPFGSMAPAPRVKSRQLLIAPANADDEDDVLLGVSTTKEKPAGVSRSPLASRLLEGGPSEKEKVPASSEQPEKRATTMAIFRRPPEPPKKYWSRKKKVAKTPMDLTASTTPAPQSSSPSARPKSRGRPRKSVGGKTQNEKESDLSVDTSSPEAKLGAKPSNQRLQVEIRTMKSFDTSSYMIIPSETTPETEPTHTTPQVNSEEEVCSAADAMDVEKALPSPPLPAAKDDQVAPSPIEPKERGSKQKGQCPSPPAEVFSRNILDPDYAFSDEDEPTLSRARVEGHKAVAGRGPGPKQGQGRVSQSATRKQRRKAKKPLTLEPISEDTDDTLMSEEVFGKELEQLEPVAESPVEVTEKEPEQVEKVAESQVTRTLDVPTFDMPSPMASDPACPPTSSPTRSKVERRATGHTAPTPEPIDTSYNQAPSSPLDISLQDHSTTTSLEQELPTERRKRKHSPAEDSPTNPSPPRLPEPFSSPGRIPRDQIIPETPDASSTPAAIRHHSPPRRSPSPDLGFRDPPPKSPILPTQPSTTSPPKSPVLPTAHKTLTINPKQPPPQTPSSKPPTTTTRRKTPGSNSILSLLSDTDTDADELAPPPSSFPPRSSRRPLSIHSTPRTRTSVSQTGASVRSLRTTPVSSRKDKGGLRRVAAAATVGRRSSSGMIRRGRDDRGGVVSSPLAAVGWSRGRGEEVVETPGGTRRRCGEGGFKCERDFCFVCL